MDRFNELLGQYAQAQGQAKSKSELKKVEDALWAEYGVEQVVFVLDMAGFSLLVQKYGIIHYLSMVRRMHILVEPIITRHNGSIVKFEADNCFARFPTVSDAIKSAIAVNHSLEGMNLMTLDDLDVRVSIGIDFGRFLLIQKKDFYGGPVNLASKLGEDIANAGQILVTDDAVKQLGDEKFPSQKINVTISGIELPTHEIIY
jgi:class 3 adenylate cyclase